MNDKDSDTDDISFNKNKYNETDNVTNTDNCWTMITKI